MNARAPRARVALAASLLTAVVILAVGCSEPPPAAEPSGAGGHTAAEYAECLRAQGLTMEQYTAEDGTLQSRPDKTRNDVAKINAAAQACRDLLPTEPDGAAGGAPVVDVEANRRYASCIREHGVPEFPDPDPRTGDFTMNDDLGRRIKENPAMRTATEACRALLPGSGGGVVGG